MATKKTICLDVDELIQRAYSWGRQRILDDNVKFTNYCDALEWSVKDKEVKEAIIKAFEAGARDAEKEMEGKPRKLNPNGKAAPSPLPLLWMSIGEGIESFDSIESAAEAFHRTRIYDDPNDFEWLKSSFTVPAVPPLTKRYTVRLYWGDEHRWWKRDISSAERKEFMRYLDEFKEKNPKSTTKSLQNKIQTQLEVDADKAKLIADALAGAHTHEEVDNALETASNLLGFYGVEPIRGEYQVDSYYLDIVALYVNSGDTYTNTIIYETETGKFIIWTLGDWVEKNQKKYKIL